jgi:pimeloyl-ACP methyl ester carboxylesterase
MRSITVDAGGPVHVADHGGAGRPMLLVHGLGGSHLNWGSVAPRLVARFRVYAVDLPGFGLTEVGRRRTTVAANIDLVAAVLERLAPEPAVVMGNSMGGLLSLGAAVRHPARVAGLVLVDPALPAPPDNLLRVDAVARGFMLTYLFPWLGIRRVRRITRLHGPEVLVRQTLALCAADVSTIDAELVAQHVHMQRRRMQLEGWDSAFFSTARSLVNMLALRRRVVSWIRQSIVPTLLVHGDRDRLITVRAARAAAALRPDWEYVEMAGVGHIPMMEKPDDFLRITSEWLQRSHLWGNDATAIDLPSAAEVAVGAP